jgi:uncharacterized protein YceH (UPF0502 family)
MARQVAMQRKGSFMDDLPAEPAGAGGMDINLDEYVPGYEDEMAYDDMGGLEGEAAEMDLDMETRIASLEDRIAQLEAMLAG